MCTKTYILIHIFFSLYTYRSIFIYIYIYTKDIYVYMYIYVYTDIYIYKCTFICICIIQLRFRMNWVLKLLQQVVKFVDFLMAISAVDCQGYSTRFSVHGMLVQHKTLCGSSSKIECGSSVGFQVVVFNSHCNTAWRVTGHLLWAWACSWCWTIDIWPLQKHA
jgi:hypothetical protein